MITMSLEECETLATVFEQAQEQAQTRKRQHWSLMLDTPFEAFPGLAEGLCVHLVEATNEHREALVEYVYLIDAEKGLVHLRIPELNEEVDAYHSETQEIGTWHFVEQE